VKVKENTKTQQCERLTVYQCTALFNCFRAEDQALMDKTVFHNFRSSCQTS